MTIKDVRLRRVQPWEWRVYLRSTGVLLGIVRKCGIQHSERLTQVWWEWHRSYMQQGGLPDAKAAILGLLREVSIYE